MNLKPGLYSSIQDNKFRINIPVQAFIGPIPTELVFAITPGKRVILTSSEAYSDVLGIHPILSDATVVKTKKGYTGTHGLNRVLLPEYIRTHTQHEREIWYVAYNNYFEVYTNEIFLAMRFPTLVQDAP
jgi:hypothetical protein